MENPDVYSENQWSQAKKILPHTALATAKTLCLIMDHELPCLGRFLCLLKGPPQFSFVCSSSF